MYSLDLCSSDLLDYFRLCIAYSRTAFLQFLFWMHQHGESDQYGSYYPILC